MIFLRCYVSHVGYVCVLAIWKIIDMFYIYDHFNISAKCTYFTKRRHEKCHYSLCNICSEKLKNYIVIQNSQFVRSISCISSYMFRLIYRAFCRLVFRVVCMYKCWCFEGYVHQHLYIQTTLKTSLKMALYTSRNM